MHDYNALYVVKVPFRAGGNHYEPGLLLQGEDLMAIKLVKIRINEQKIVPVPEKGKKLDLLCDYMQVRMGVDLHKKLAERVSKGSGSAESEKPSASTPPTGTQKVAVKPLSTTKQKPAGK